MRRRSFFGMIAAAVFGGGAAPALAKGGVVRGPLSIRPTKFIIQSTPGVDVAFGKTVWPRRMPGPELIGRRFIEAKGRIAVHAIEEIEDTRGHA